MVFESFVYSLLDSGDFKSLGLAKEEYFTVDDFKVISYLNDYFIKFNKMPDVTTVEVKFKTKLHKNTSPPEYWLKELKDKNVKNVIDDTLRLLVKSKNPISTLTDALHKIQLDDPMAATTEYGANTKERYDRYINEKKKNLGVTYLSTGDLKLDEFTGGYRKGDLWLIAGYEKIGKSFKLLRLANEVSRTIAVKFPDKKALFVSLEVNEDEFMDRLDCINAGISYERFDSGKLKKEEMLKLKSYYKQVENNPDAKEHRLLLESRLSKMSDLESFIRIYKPAIVFVDSVHLWSASLDWKDMMKITQQLKNTARATNTPIIVTAHANLKEGDEITKMDGNVFSYFKAGRDPDFSFVMFRDTKMAVLGLTGMLSAFSRRKRKFVQTVKTNWETMHEETVDICYFEDFSSDDLDDSMF